LAKITRTQRRLVASSIAFILTAAMMMPTTTDARGGGGGSFGGHGGGGSFGGHGGGKHFGLPGTVRTIGPSVAGPATVRRSSFATSARAASPPHMSFSHRNASFSHARRIGSHVFTLGADGIWVDNFVYTPTILVAQQPVLVQQQLPVHSRAAAVKTPSAEQAGIIVVRGDTKSYVTFPSPKRG
jgi:hypothetical protein